MATYQEVESEEWQLGEIQAAISEVDSGHGVRHEKVSNWLKSWGNSHETTPSQMKCPLTIPIKMRPSSRAPFLPRLTFFKPNLQWVVRAVYPGLAS